jgi:hypothetical protein
VNADEAHSRTGWCLIPLYVISPSLYTLESRDQASISPVHRLKEVCIVYEREQLVSVAHRKMRVKVS